MKPLPIALVAAVIVGAGISTALLASGLGPLANPQAGAISTSTTLPGTSVSISSGVPIVTTVTASLSGLPHG